LANTNPGIGTVAVLMQGPQEQLLEPVSISISALLLKTWRLKKHWPFPCPERYHTMQWDSLAIPNACN
jgi:hypothetical protein